MSITSPLAKVPEHTCVKCATKFSANYSGKNPTCFNCLPSKTGGAARAQPGGKVFHEQIARETRQYLLADIQREREEMIKFVHIESEKIIAEERSKLEEIERKKREDRAMKEAREYLRSHSQELAGAMAGVLNKDMPESEEVRNCAIGIIMSIFDSKIVS